MQAGLGCLQLSEQVLTLCRASNTMPTLQTQRPCGKTSTLKPLQTPHHCMHNVNPADAGTQPKVLLLSCSSAHKAGLLQGGSAPASAPARCSATVCECMPQSTARSVTPAHCKLRQLCGGFSESLDDAIHGTQQQIMQTLSCKHANSCGVQMAHHACVRQQHECGQHTMHAASRAGWSGLQLLAHPPHHCDNTAVCCFECPLAPQHASTAWVDLQDRTAARSAASTLCV